MGDEPQEKKVKRIKVTPAPKPETEEGGSSWVGTVIEVLFISAIVVFIIVSIYQNYHKHILVEEKYWTATVDIEEYKAVEKSDWKLPEGAKLLYTQKEIQSYKRHGFGFGQYDAVYATKYYYEIEEWVQTRDVTVTGKESERPYYGTVTLAENEREKGRSVTYNIKAVWDNGQVTGELPVERSVWDKLKVGHYYRATAGTVDGVSMVVKAKEKNGF